jgi:5-methyltetrahydrofolate--homocysteine methyltransferase
MEDIALDAVEALMRRDVLFASRWQFRQGQSDEEWRGLRREKIEPLYESLMSKVRARKIVVPKAVYGHFACERVGNGLLVKGERKDFRFDFPREAASPNRCISDLFPYGFASFMLVTAGPGVAAAAAASFAEHRYSDAFYLKGLAAEFAEAAASLCHRIIRQELGVAEDAGCRFSPGYPAFPSLIDQRKIFELLGGGRIGLEVTQTCQLVPEHSVSAIVSVDPKAELFRP